MGWLSDKLFGKKKSLDINKIKDYQANTQGLVTEQLGIARDLMDPNSAINKRQKMMMAQRAAEVGAQSSRDIGRTAAMMGGQASPGQILMQQRMAQNQAMGGVDSQFMDTLGTNFTSGMGLMTGMTGMQQGLDENLANAYVNKIAQHNQARQGRISNVMGLAGAAMGMTGSILQGSGSTTP